MCLLFFLCWPWQAFSAVWIITYPQSEVENDVRYDYPLALLELALQKTGVRYKIKQSMSPMRQARALKRLEENLEVNVVWSMTDVLREQQLRPIRIPIARGLIGWRVFVSHKNSPFLQAPIKDMADLLRFSPVQGVAWPDTKILQANGFNVITARDYVEGTELVNNKLADFFPRSVVEVLQELENQYSRNLQLRKGLAFYYPAAQYFFTNKQNITLSRLIETGINRAIEDGSYDKLFNEHYGETLEKLDFKNSLYFRLANPLLPPLTPIGQSQYWYVPIQG
ncbi:MAG: hypothetical protein ACJAVV_003246 [Alphaproteobacteria bacterium]|jgi:hypothetical protein